MGDLRRRLAALEDVAKDRGGKHPQLVFVDDEERILDAGRWAGRPLGEFFDEHRDSPRGVLVIGGVDLNKALGRGATT